MSLELTDETDWNWDAELPVISRKIFCIEYLAKNKTSENFSES